MTSRAGRPPDLVAGLLDSIGAAPGAANYNGCELAYANDVQDNVTVV
jgi:hypothetical protein